MQTIIPSPASSTNFDGGRSMNKLTVILAIAILTLCGGSLFLMSRAVDATAPTLAEHATRPESGMDTVMRSRTTPTARNHTPIWLALAGAGLLVAGAYLYVRHESNQVALVREQRLLEKARRADALDQARREALSQSAGHLPQLQPPPTPNSPSHYYLPLLLIGWLLIGCTTPAPTAHSGLGSADEARQAYMTLAAAETREANATQEARAAATAQVEAIATGTAVAIGAQQTATADSLNVRATIAAIDAQSTREAIAAQATAADMQHQQWMVNQAAIDEAQRLAIQRDRERQWLQIEAYLWAALITAVIPLALAISYWFYRRSQPWIVSPGEGHAPMVIGSSGHRLLEPACQPRLTISTPQPTPPLALPTPQVQPLPQLAAGHALVAGETGSGKTTALRAVLQPRPQVIILDPHARAGQWPDYEVIGGGRNWQAIARFLEQMDGELNGRYQRRLHGETNFQPLTIATDEMNSIVQEVGKEIGRMWRQWLREGRKVGLYFVTSSHSTRVGPLGIKGEGDLLLNFHQVVMLGKVAQENYRELVQGMERPAVLATQSGARPIIIPHIPEAGNSSPSNAHTPLYTAPRPAGPRPIDTQWGTITPEDALRALRMFQAGASRRSIEEAIYGHAGGAAYHKIKHILDNATQFAGHQNAATE